MSRSIFSTLYLRSLRTPRLDFRRNLTYSRFLLAEVTNDGPAVTATNRAQITAKRFWKTVGIEERPDCFVVNLDKRPLKTPSGVILEIPKSKRLLASLIAHEWDNQDILIKPFALPLTSLAARAVDNFQNEESRRTAIQALLKYLDTDTICFFTETPAHPLATDNPRSLIDLQEKHWAPLLDWARKEFDTEIRRFDTVMFAKQPKETIEKIQRVLESLNPWELAAVERAVYATKSLLIALALVKGRLSVEEAAQTAHVEVTCQIQNWGEVEDSHDVDHQELRRQLGSAAILLV
ncbi:hypothetical protein M422DRAFT_76024 [Sphaerobolus stellatus SS14]|uniref:ATP synthase mitochondrial F1 complex assembly factor 2 n=1 Tax=Sphaerobolus stellatus (strain SS14) TaxID=990650 RepID=A0A0C9USB2_SPHS4|nr:hypothetical protein M422DRAFT_76024 [Sphaerobolus stellatus SS14]